MLMLEDSPYADRTTSVLVEIQNSGQAESLMGLSLFMFVALSVTSMLIISGRKYGYTKMFRTFCLSAFIFSPIMIFSVLTINIINSEQNKQLVESLNTSLQGKTTIELDQAAQAYEIGYATIYSSEDSNSILVRDKVNNDGVTFTYTDKLTDEEYTSFLQSQITSNPASSRFVNVPTQ